MAHKTSRVIALVLLGACNTSTPQTSAPDAPGVVPPLPDAPAPDAFVIPGTHYQYIIDRLDLPTSPGELQNWSVDLDGVNGVDNALGHLIGLMANQGFLVSTPTTQAINRGSILTLIDLQTTDFQNAPVVGIQIFHGADPMPAPCGIISDITCRHHLDGSGHFTIATDDPHHPAMLGAIQDGMLTTTAGDFALQLSLGVAPLIDLPLTDAHLHFLSTADKSIGTTEAAKAGAVLAGAVRAADMTTFITQLATAGESLVARDCSGITTSAATCGCTAGSPGAAMITFFDTDHDCKVELTEVQNSTVLAPLIAPDITLPDATMAVSIGLGVHAVPATFTNP